MKKRILGVLVSLVMIISFCIVNVEAASTIVLEVSAYGNFETAGIDIKVNKTYITSSTFEIEYKASGESVYKKGHNFVKYDGNHMATSLFNLSLNTTYDIRILVDGNVEATTTVKTKPEFSIPEAQRQTVVRDSRGLNEAIYAAKAGDEILLDPLGSYRLSRGSYFTISSRKGTQENPIVIKTYSNSVRAKIENRVQVSSSAHVIFYNVEITTEDDQGMRIDDSSYISVVNSYIHDNRSDGMDSNISLRDTSNSVKECHHLFLNNIISDDVNEGKVNDYFKQAAGQTYYGINTGGRMGGMITIRGNEFYGLMDGMHTGGKEKESGDPFNADANRDDYLYSWPGQNIDVYDNLIYNCMDDCIETDGHMVNGRYFRNRLGNANNSITLASNFPGPNFFIYNYVSGGHENNIKLNTAGDEVTRGAFFYHNTFVQPSHGANVFNRSGGNAHNNMTFKNNIFYALGKALSSELGSNNRSVDFASDYNLLYTTSNSTFGKGFLGRNRGSVNYDTFEAYKAGLKTATAGTYIGNPEENSINANPKLDLTNLYRDIARDTTNSILMLSIADDSPGVDKAVRIPGINDIYAGAGPDMGAYEVGAPYIPVPTVEVTPIPTIYPPTPTPTISVVVPVAKPAKVSGIKTVNKKKKTVDITWKKTKNAKGYEVYRSLKKNKSFKKIKTLTSESKVKFINKKLKKGKTYYYKVRAYNLDGNKKVYGAYSAVKKVKVKK